MITWRHVTQADFPLLGHWLKEPHVARWWNHETEPAAVERDFGPAARGEEPAEDSSPSSTATPSAWCSAAGSATTPSTSPS